MYLFDLSRVSFGIKKIILKGQLNDGIILKGQPC